MLEGQGTGGNAVRLIRQIHLLVGVVTQIAHIFRLVIVGTRIVIAGENILTPPPLLPCETNDAISGPWLESAPAVTLSSWTSVRRTASRSFAVSTKDNGAAALTQQRS